MPRAVEIIERTDVFQQAIFRIEKITLKFERFDGSMSEPLTRLVLHRGDSVGILMYERGLDAVLLCEQFRVPTIGYGEGWLLELPAGMLEDSESPEATARREVLEETGYAVRRLESIGYVFLSPGGSSEQIHLFFVEVALTDRTSPGGGQPEEGEDIRLVPVAVEEAFAMVSGGRIRDAKTLIALQWLALHLDRQSGEVR
jgi:nudix-type nucleoside diphosphatase (YffH/AdpP family)